MIWILLATFLFVFVVVYSIGAELQDIFDNNDIDDAEPYDWFSGLNNDE